MNKPVVAVFFGGMSSEHDISCLSAVTVAGGLDREKYDMVLVGITKEGKWLLVKNIEAMKDGSWRESREKAALLPDASEKSLVITAEDGSMRKQRIDVAFRCCTDVSVRTGRSRVCLSLQRSRMSAAA